MRQRRWSVVLAMVVTVGSALGGLLGVLPGTEASAASTSGVTVAGGTQGSAANQLSNPQGVFVDGAGNVYVSDTGNGRVQEWAPGATSGSTVAGSGGPGGSTGLSSPEGVWVDRSGDVYVTDSGNDRVQEWAPGATAGVTVAGGNGPGSAANQLDNPTGLFVDGSGNVYVADNYNHRVQKWAPGATAGVTVAGGNGAGAAANQLDLTTVIGGTTFFAFSGVFVDGSGNVYVSDTFNDRVQKWAPSSTAGVTVAGGNGLGSAANQLVAPGGLYVDGVGNLYIADTFNYRVQEWAPGVSAGVTVAGGNLQGSAANQLSNPEDVYVDSAGNVYVADTTNNRVQEWAPGPNAAPSVTLDPQSQTITENTNVSFTAAASGQPLPTAQWQQSTDGGSTWSDITGATSATYAITNVPLSDNGFEFRAVFTNGSGSATTNTATLTVNPPVAPAVATQPTSQSVVETTNVSFNAAASGAPPPTVQWQQSTDGGSTWSDISGATSNTYTITGVPLSDNGFEFRAVFTNAVGTATTNAATLTVTPPPPPTTSVVDPTNGATVSGSIWLDGAASSPVGITSVSYEVSGGSVSDQVVGSGTPTLIGYLGVWDTHDVPNGTYTLQNVATDTFGQSTTSAPITVTVDNPPLQTAVVLPANGATLTGGSWLDASANGTSDITGVQYVLSGGSLSNQVIATATATLYGWLAGWNTVSVPNGTYTLQSVATDETGATATSPGITVTVSN